MHPKAHKIRTRGLWLCSTSWGCLSLGLINHFLCLILGVQLLYSLIGYCFIQFQCVWMEGSRPCWNFMTIASPSVYSAFSMSSLNSSIYSSTEHLPWWYWHDSNWFMALVHSCKGKNWYQNASLNSFQSLKWTLPVFDACANTHKANVAAFPIFMKDKVHRIWAWSSWNSFTHSPKYRVHELKNVHPFAQSPLYLEGFTGLAKQLEAVLMSPKAAPGRLLDIDHQWISNKSVPLHHPPLHLFRPKVCSIPITSLTPLHSSLSPLPHPSYLCSLFHWYPFPCHYDPLISHIVFSPHSCLSLFHASTFHS